MTDKIMDLQEIIPRDYIQAPNSPIKFDKPKFNCKLYEYYKGNFYGRVDQSMRKWNANGTNVGNNANKKFNLNLYKKKWYLHQHNFPCLCINEKTGEPKVILKKEDYSREYRLATQQEAEMLYIK